MIGVADELKVQLPVGFLVLKAGIDRVQAEIATEVVQMVRERIGPVASFKTAVVVERLPKTRSGKILRGTMRRIADGQEYSTPATIDDSHEPCVPSARPGPGSATSGCLTGLAGVRRPSRSSTLRNVTPYGV